MSILLRLFGIMGLSVSVVLLLIGRNMLLLLTRSIMAAAVPDDVADADAAAAVDV